MNANQNMETALDSLTEKFFKEAPSSAAYRLETITVKSAAEILERIPIATASAVWEILNPHYGAQIINHLPVEFAGEILTGIDPGRAASILALVDQQTKDSVLSIFDEPTAHKISELIDYPHDSAGGLMDSRVLTFRGNTTVNEAKQIIRNAGLRTAVHELRIVDDHRVLKSLVDIKDFALAESAASLDSIAKGIEAVVRPMDTRDEIIEKMEEFRLEELTVIDDNGHILGVIRYSTLMDTLKESVSLDIQTMVGASKDETANSSIGFAVRKRMPWLQINLLTAFLAAAVVGLFEGTIAKFTALAVLLPVVAGQSGNAGAQALAVTMRGLSLREVKLGDWLKMAIKEGNVGLWNGISIAIVCGIGVYVWSGTIGLVLVIVSSMIISMILAGLAGALIPMGLMRIGQDPAVASSIVLTTVTDIAGFFSFLGIATLLAGMLV